MGWRMLKEFEHWCCDEMKAAATVPEGHDLILERGEAGAIGARCPFCKAIVWDSEESGRGHV